MIKEEKVLRKFLNGGYYPDSIPAEKPVLSKLITALVRACYEDAAKNVKAEWNAYFTSERDCDIVCAAIRSKK